MSAINHVKFYLYPGMIFPQRRYMRQILALAYQSVTDRGITPRAILIRSGWHPTTSSTAGHVKDPFGGHYTFACKDEEQMQNNTHTTVHGYTPSPTSFELTRATLFDSRHDSIMRSVDKPLWPEEGLIEVASVGYSHLAEEGVVERILDNVEGVDGVEGDVEVPKTK